jgi:hypothetical protein
MTQRKAKKAAKKGAKARAAASKKKRASAPPPAASTETAGAPTTSGGSGKRPQAPASSDGAGAPENRRGRTMEPMTLSQVHDALFEIANRHGDGTRKLKVETGRSDQLERGTTFRLFTAAHEYFVHAIAPGERLPWKGDGPDRGYLGCIAQTLRVRPGEHDRRGNDLPDGPLTRETLDAILLAIVGYELVEFVAEREPVAEAVGSAG